MDTRTFRVTMVVSLPVTLVFGLLVASMSCANRTLGVTRSSRTAGTESSRPLGLDLYRPEPADNPTLSDRVTLGQRLFRERLLSRDRSLACVDCHRPDRAFTDGRAKAVGVYGRRGPRSVPTIVNRASGKSFFWDGRIATLEEQVLQPILAELEMDLSLDEAVERLGGTSPYPAAFRETFGRDLNRATTSPARWPPMSAPSSRATRPSIATSGASRPRSARRRRRASACFAAARTAPPVTWVPI